MRRLRLSRSASTPLGRVSLGVAAVALSLTLAACGSQLDPNDVVGAGGFGNGQGGGTAAGGTGGGFTDGGVDPGTSAGGDTGSIDGGGTTSSGGGGGSTSSGGGGSTGGSSGGGGGGGTGEAPNGDGKAASCAGFKNQTGVTDDKIIIGNSSDVSGPVPGLFESAQEATKAYVAYFNASGAKICGRSLELKSYDSRTDAAADQQSYTRACDEVFAMVGSMSAFDSGGAATAQNCGMPDIRSAAVTRARYACTTCFGAQSTKATEFQNAVPDFVLKNYGSAGQNAAMLYINAGAAAENGKTQSDAMNKRGMKFKYLQGIDVSEFNYAPYVQSMKDKGIEYVQFIGAYQQAVRLAQAMEQQSFKPKIYILDPTAYTPEYVKSGGSAVEGTVIFTNFTPFEEAGSNPETQLYLNWLQQVKPGATPGFFGAFSWSAARLFVERATALGGKLSRPAMVADLRTVNKWTANNLTSPQNVGSKRTGDCWRFITLKGGRWVPLGGTKYTCNGTTSVS